MLPVVRLKYPVDLEGRVVVGVTAVVVVKDPLAVDAVLLVVRLKYAVELKAEELPDVDVKLETVELVELEVEVPVEELLKLAEVKISVVELEDEVLELDEALDVDEVVDVEGTLEAVDEVVDVDETLEAVVDVVVKMLAEMLVEVLVEVVVEVGRVALLQLHSSKYPFMRSAYEVPLIGLFSDSVAS